MTGTASARQWLFGRRLGRAVLLGLIGGLVAPLLLGTAGSAHAAPTPSPPAPSPSAPAASAPAGEVTWGAAPANDTLGTNRSHFSYSLAAGTRITDALAVANRSEQPITLAVYASDAFTTSTGAIDVLPANKKPVDVGSWITVSRPTITLQPQQSTVVPFTLTIPANATPGDHSGGVVTSLVTSSGSVSVALDRRLGSRVYLRVPGTLAPALQVKDVQVAYQGPLNPARSGSTTITYTVTNPGNIRLQAHQTVRVRGPLGLLSRTATLAGLPELLPGSSLTRTVTVSGVWPTTHLSATVRLQPIAAPDDPPIAVAAATGSDTTWGWPWGQLLVLVLAAAAMLGYRWLRRRRRDQVAAAIAAAVSQALNQNEPTDPTHATATDPPEGSDAGSPSEP